MCYTSLTVYEADTGGQGGFGSMSLASHLGSVGLKVIISLACSPFRGFGSGWIPETCIYSICLVSLVVNMHTFLKSSYHNLCLPDTSLTFLSKKKKKFTFLSAVLLNHINTGMENTHEDQ